MRDDMALSDARKTRYCLPWRAKMHQARQRPLRRWWGGDASEPTLSGRRPARPSFISPNTACGTAMTAPMNLLRGRITQKMLGRRVYGAMAEILHAIFGVPQCPPAAAAAAKSRDPACHLRANGYRSVCAEFESNGFAVAAF